MSNVLQVGMYFFICNCAHVDKQDRLWKLVDAGGSHQFVYFHMNIGKNFECSTASLYIKKYINYNFGKYL